VRRWGNDAGAMVLGDNFRKLHTLE
jgi:hypothetical protein